MRLESFDIDEITIDKRKSWLMTNEGIWYWHLNWYEKSLNQKKKFDKYFWCIIVGQTSEELFKENSILIMIEQIYKPVYVSYY